MLIAQHIEVCLKVCTRSGIEVWSGAPRSYNRQTMSTKPACNTTCVHVHQWKIYSITNRFSIDFF